MGQGGRKSDSREPGDNESSDTEEQGKVSIVVE